MIITCDIVAPVVQGVVLKASHSAREAEMAFNGAADRIEKQLRRYTNRLKEHKVDESAAGLCRECRLHDLLAGAKPTTAKQRTFPRSSPKPGSTFPKSSVSDAVMLMDLRNTNALDVQEQRHRRVQHDLPPRRREHRLG